MPRRRAGASGSDEGKPLELGGREEDPEQLVAVSVDRVVDAVAISAVPVEARRGLATLGHADRLVGPDDEPGRDPGRVGLLEGPRELLVGQRDAGVAGKNDREYELGRQVEPVLGVLGAGVALRRAAGVEALV